ncbi:MAG: hypothetical protein RL076_274 [Chloroflexota bacterium]|jgi:phytoene desaturase
MTRVVVIGGGLGGMAAAIRSAVAGYDTTLVEAREALGGKLNIVRDQGFVWDIGPSLLTMPWVLDDLLRSAGSSLAQELDVIPLPSACRYLWQDGTRFDAYASLPALQASIAAIDPRDVGNFMRFMAYAQHLWELCADTFLYAPFHGWRSLLNPRLLRDAWALDGMRPMATAVASAFASPHMQQVMNRFATYNGSSPYRTPATFNLIAWAEFGLGAFYVRGGLYRIAEVLTATARRVGVTVRLNTRATRITHQQRRVTAVHLSDGDVIETSRVISNVDPQMTLAQLVDAGQTRAARLATRELATSGLVVLWGLDRQYDVLDHHTICFSPNYRAEFADTDAGRLHATPTIYLNHTTTYDPEHAPAGCQNVFALINVPPLQQSHIDWQTQAQPYVAQLAARLESFGLTDLRKHIQVQHIITPPDLARMYNAPAGSIYGLASNTLTSAFVRPTQRDTHIQGLIYCGGGTHPGGGIPLALLSGKHATTLLT